MPDNAIELEVFHAVPAALENANRASKTVVHLLEVGHVLNHYDERAQHDGAQQHALTSIKAVVVFAAVVVVGAAALALQRDGDDIALVDGEAFEWKRLVDVVSDDGDAWGSVSTLEHARRSGADIPGADKRVSRSNETEDLAAYACTD